MRKADLVHNHKSLDDAIDQYREFMERIVSANIDIKTQADKRIVAESILLRLCANWESFVDEHLVDCVNVDSSRLNEFFDANIPKHPSKDLCTALLFGDRYLSFPSFAQLKGYTKKILPDSSNPFLAITNTQGNRIDEVYTVRSYLAHYSARSKRQLHHVYKTKHNMTRFLEPGQFLLAYSARRLKSYFNTFEAASNSMKVTY